MWEVMLHGGLPPYRQLLGWLFLDAGSGHSDQGSWTLCVPWDLESLYADLGSWAYLRKQRGRL